MDFEKGSTKALLEIHNECAKLAGLLPTNRFSDRNSAVRRTREIFKLVEAKSKTTSALKNLLAAAGISAASKEEAKPTPAPKAAGPTKAKAEQKPKSPPKENASAVRPGSNREKILAVLEKNMGQAVSSTILMETIYGEARKDYRGPLAMVLRGIENVIKAKGLKRKLIRTRQDKENHFALFTTK